MGSGSNVGTIFSAAGGALNFLGHLTMLLDSTPSSAAGKWNDEQMELLLGAITRFGDSLRRLEERVRSRQALEVMQTVKTEEFRDAEIPYESTVNVQMSNETSNQETFVKSEIVDARFYGTGSHDDDDDDEEEDDDNDNGATNPEFVRSQ